VTLQPGVILELIANVRWGAVKVARGILKKGISRTRCYSWINLAITLSCFFFSFGRLTMITPANR
jgi:hypothetical protein